APRRQRRCGGGHLGPPACRRAHRRRPATDPPRGSEPPTGGGRRPDARPDRTGGRRMSGATAITIFVVSLIAAIMLHELGHFLTARCFGMRADRYFLGFGPTLWSMRRGETEYGVKAIPAGGF